MGRLPSERQRRTGQRQRRDNQGVDHDEAGCACMSCGGSPIRSAAAGQKLVRTQESNRSRLLSENRLRINSVAGVIIPNGGELANEARSD
jgi:hypothetical protein